MKFLQALAQPKTLAASFYNWLIHEAFAGIFSFMISLTINLCVLLGFLFMGEYITAKPVNNAPSFESVVETELPEPNLTRFEVDETPIEPSVLDTESLTLTDAPQIQEGEMGTEPGGGALAEGGGMEVDSSMPALGGLGGFEVSAVGDGPAIKGMGGVGVSVGTGRNAGGGGAGHGFEGRGDGSRQAMVGTFGGTRTTERSVAAALSWIARHQNADGSWSLDYHHNCKDPTCTGMGTANSNSAATAMALLPFFAAGQTHKTKGPYQKTIYGGLHWLIRNQKADGNLSAGSGQVMYSHGLAAIAVCEAYGLSKDPAVRGPATAALNFIVAGQDQKTGGWWYQFKQPGGDTSVFGWQLMALKSGDMAGLGSSSTAFEGARVWLRTCAKGSQGGLFSYRPDSGPGPAMTAVGLLCSQYMGVPKDHPSMQEGVKYLMAHMPNEKSGRNCYYTYYATQVMHNIPGADWDKWNRTMRRGFIENQVKEGCATGSWDPEKPSKDAWSEQGGRIMLTSLATLSLEVYYRYLPLYQLDKRSEPKFELQ